MENGKFIYVVFEKTTLGMGKFIRAVTGFPYNHAGISFSPEINRIFSFSRRYKKAPFYGGFTEESPLRLKNGNKIADIMICAIPVTEENFKKAEKRIESLSKNSGEYIYNMISAAVFPLKRSVKIEKSFTCAEFVLSMLKEYAEIPELENKEFCSIRELCGALSPLKIYEGSAEKYISDANWGNDTFPEKKKPSFYLIKTAGNNAELLKRFLNGK